jgi:hypothetical protein
MSVILSGRSAWREKGGPIKHVKVPGFHARLTGPDIRKQFFSLRGHEKKQRFLVSVMRDYPLQVVDSGLIALFDTEEACVKRSETLKWVHRLARYSNNAPSAFQALKERQQRILLMVLHEGRSIEDAARALQPRISRKHCYTLFKSAVLSVFPEYKEARLTVRKLRDQLAEIMKPENTGREQSGNTEDYLDYKATRGYSGRGWDQSDEDTE